MKQAWPSIVDECLKVLGSELHYQAMVYHCLRQYAQVPVDQLGMNVKMLISNPASALFKKLDRKRHADYQGAFEPIPDVVIFSPEIDGDWRRRNREKTLKSMLMAIEVKASERQGGRLRYGELSNDIEKLAAHREEVEHLGSDMLPVMMVIDTAPEETERTRNETIKRCVELARERDVLFLYLSSERTIETW